MEPRKTIWTTSEINTLLDVMIEEKALLLMNNKKTRNKEVYKMLTNRLQEFGYDRDEEQIKTKFQKLKAQFVVMSANNNRRGSTRMDDNFYGKMDQILKQRAAPSFKHTVMHQHQEPRLESKPGSNKIYQSVVKTMTEGIKAAIKEQTDKLICSLEKLQKEDHKWQEEMQRSDQAFLLQLFGQRDSHPEPACYSEETTYE